MTYSCRRRLGELFFAARKGTIMEASSISPRIWAIGIDLFTTRSKLFRELGISQKSAWFMPHRLREAAETGSGPFPRFRRSREDLQGWESEEYTQSGPGEELTGRGGVGAITTYGTYDKMGLKHLSRNVQKFLEHRNIRELNTLERMAGMVTGMEGTQLRYGGWIRDNELSSGVRG